MSEIATSNLADPSGAGSFLSPDQSLLRGKSSILNGDSILRGFSASAAFFITIMLAMLLVVLTIAAVPAIRSFGASFITRTQWRPNELEQVQRDARGYIVRDADGDPVVVKLPPEFGALPVIWGTAVSSVLSLLVAVPVSFGAAIFLIRIAPRWLVAPVSFLIEFLAAIPSIAYGIWGLFVLAPFLQGNVAVWSWLSWIHSVPGLSWMFSSIPNPADPSETVVVFRGLEPILASTLGHVPGFSTLFDPNLAHTGRDMLCGGLVLAIMIIPIITAISRDVLCAVPRAQIEGTIALGATWWQSCREMLKYSRSGLFGGVMLGLARAAGETMAVTMVIGNKNQIAMSLFAPAQTMSSLLANEFAEASDELHRSALAGVALILLVMSLIFNVVARYLVVGKQSRTAAAH